jgi:uncharacterized membrane protein SirB2
MSYFALKYLHVGAVIGSFSPYFVRGLRMMAALEKLTARWVQEFPHVHDTVLLVCAIALVAKTAQGPFVQAWLTAKVLALPA